MGTNKANHSGKNILHLLLSKGVLFVCSLSFAFIIPSSSYTQTDSLDTVIERIIEIYIENSDEEEFDYNTAFENLSLLLRNPLNLNKATERELKMLMFLSPVQINDILEYKVKYGEFLHMHELQAIRSMDLQTIKMMLPFATVDKKFYSNDLSYHLRNSRSTLFTKYKRVLQDRKGYLPRPDGNTPYLGDPNHLYLRYRLESGHNLRAGITMEKDPGEPFFSGINKKGFDFYSFFIYVQRPIKYLKTLSVGDYSISLGQGLILHNDFGTNKSAFVMNIKKGGKVIRPYSSVNEVNFFRGAAITIDLGKKFDLTFFYSYKNTNGSVNSIIDTLDNSDFETFTSFNLSGFHRTLSEISKKAAVTQQNLGGRLEYFSDRIQLGLNYVNYSFSIPIQRSPQLYNQFFFSGDFLSNLSVDYNFRFRNFNFVGEATMSNNGGKAMIHSVLVGLDRCVDLALSYRKYDPDYQVIEGNALSEASQPINEEGIYMGIETRLSNRWKVSAYTDMWRNPWLRFRVDAPGTGREYLIRIDYLERKKLNTFLQYRFENKLRNEASSEFNIRKTEPATLHRLRLQNNYKVNRELEIRNRFEVSKFIDNRESKNGFMIAQDIIYKPFGKSYSMNVRFALFDVDSFDSRIYMYENDILYEFGIPFFYNQGSRFYLNYRKRLTRKITWEFRYARTFYTNIDKIGSGNETIDGNVRSDVKTQLRINF